MCKESPRLTSDHKLCAVVDLGSSRCGIGVGCWWMRHARWRPGPTCLSDVEAMTAQEEIFGPGGGASDSTMLRALDELAERLGGDGLPGRRLARGSRGGAGHGVGGDRGPPRAAARGAGCR